MFGSGEGGRARRRKDEQLYAAAVAEIERGEQRKGLWAKALADAKFDPAATKALYLKLRVQAMKDEIANVGRDRATAATSGQPAVGRAAQQQCPRCGLVHGHEGPTFAEFLRFSRTTRVAMWLIAGAFLYQAYDWLVFSQPFTLNPFAALGNLLHSITRLELGVYAFVQGAAYLALLYFLFRAVTAAAYVHPRMKLQCPSAPRRAIVATSAAS